MSWVRIVTDVSGPYTQLSGRGDRIRTCDILLPKQARYRAALHPDTGIMPSRTAKSQRCRISCIAGLAGPQDRCGTMSNAALARAQCKLSAAQRPLLTCRYRSSWRMTHEHDRNVAVLSSAACARSRSTARWRTRHGDRAAARFRARSSRSAICRSTTRISKRRRRRRRGAFRDAIRAADAVLFVTPEYNRSVPGVLKNAIDVGSRPSGKSAWSGKPGGVVSVSPGALGAFGANHALRQSLVASTCRRWRSRRPTSARPAALFDESGKLVNDSDARSSCEKFVAAFAAWIERNAPSA